MSIEELGFTELEGNTAIAEYEGLPFAPWNGNRSVDAKFTTYKACKDYIIEHELDGFEPELGWKKKSGNYRHDFRELMRVVEKIIRTKYEDGDNAHLRTFGMENAIGELQVRINRCQLFQADTLIEATWLAVVDWCKATSITP